MALRTNNSIALRTGLIKEQEAAEYIGLSVRTLRTQRVRGGGPYFYKIGRSVRYRREELDKFIALYQYSNTSQYPS